MCISTPARMMTVPTAVSSQPISERPSKKRKAMPAQRQQRQAEAALAAEAPVGRRHLHLVEEQVAAGGDHQQAGDEHTEAARRAARSTRAIWMTTGRKDSIGPHDVGFLRAGRRAVVGLYGPTLHRGQVMLGSPMKALLCVGIAYFLVGVLVPVITLGSQGDLKGFNTAGTLAATGAGMLGAIGAVFIIFAFRSGGLPAYVMPLVFGGAPLVNVLVSMAMHPLKEAPNPLLWVGYVLASVGAALVLYFKPA